MNEPVTLITGGTGGLGRSVTTAFLSRSGQVVVTYRRESERDTLVELVGDQKDRLLTLAVDVAVEIEINGLVERILVEYGRIDSLVHLIGGYAGGQSVAETSLATLEHMLTLNLKSAFLATKAVLPHMQARRTGKIVTVASRGAVQPDQGSAAYAASKAGIIALTQAIAAEVGADQINANVILPGMIDTPANRVAMPDADFSKWVSPEAIAQTILFLCSPQAEGINGAAIPIYG